MLAIMFNISTKPLNHILFNSSHNLWATKDVLSKILLIFPLTAYFKRFISKSRMHYKISKFTFS